MENPWQSSFILVGETYIPIANIAFVKFRGDKADIYLRQSAASQKVYVTMIGSDVDHFRDWLNKAVVSQIFIVE